MHLLIQWALRLALLALILLAVLLTVVRLALPFADRYREPLTQALSARLHHPLTVETMRLRLVGWSPQLVLANVTIGSQQGGADLLRLRALQLDLDPFASLMAGEPRLSLLTLVGAELALHRARDGRVGLAGLAEPGTDDPGALATLLTARELAITDGDLRFTDDALGGAQIRLTQLSLRLHNAGRLHRFTLAANPVAAAAPAPGVAPVAVPIDAQFQLRADLRGAAGDTRQWGGEVYLSLVGGDLAPLVPSSLGGPGLLSSQGIHLESWNRLEQGELRESLNRIGLNGVVLRRPAGPDPAGVPMTDPEADPKVDSGVGTAGMGLARSPPLLVLDHLDGLVRLTPRDLGWRVETAQLGLAVDGAGVADLGLDLRLAADARLRALDLVVADLDLSLVARVLGARPRSLTLEASALDPQRMAALDPRGRLEKLVVRVRLPPQGPSTWQVAADIRGLGLRRLGQWPGITGLNAILRANQDGGTLGFGTTGLGLDLRPRLDSILRFERLGGGLTWARGPAGGWQVASTELVLGNQDLTARAHFTLDLPEVLPGPAPGTGPVLDLQAGIEDADLAQLRRYLPVAATGAVGWLTQALVAGRLPRGDLVLRGPLQRFPFGAGEGRFEVNLDYRDLVLRYLPGWPPIEAAAGGLRVAAQGLEVRLDAGRLYQTELSQGRATIADLWDPRRLSIQVTASGPFADGLQFVRDTPLDEPLGPLARVLELDGRSQLVLGLELPLDAAGALTLDGRLSWPGPAGLRLLGTPLQLTALAGDLRFGLGSVQAAGIRARLWGAPVTLAIDTVAARGTRLAATRIQARSRTPVEVLADAFASPWWRVGSGDLDWDLAVDLYSPAPSRDSPMRGNPTRGDRPGQRTSFAFTLRSDLRGLALDLPRPLGKTAAPARPLVLTGVPLPGGGLAISGSWEPLAWDLVLDPDAGPPRLARGRVTLGARRAAAPTAPGLVIDGSLEALDPPAWLGWWERVGVGLGTGLGIGRDASIDPQRVLGPVSADLRVARLDLGWASLTGAQVQAAPTADGWVLSLVSRQLAGQVRLPGSSAGSAQPLLVQVERIDLKALVPQRQPERGALGAQPAPTTAALSLPALDLRVSDLRWGAARLGHLALDVRPHGSVVEVPRLDYAGPGDTRVTGSADAQDAPDGTFSHLVLALKSTDTGPLLRALDYTPLLSPAPVEARLRLGWAGGPGDFTLLQSTGRIELDVGPGRLLDVSPGVGRVLGSLNSFLNLYELRRRLSLDIADLYAKGFAFNRITGRIDLGCGQARVQTFEIAASSSDIQVRGIANLRTRTYDQLVTVVPSLGTSLALASGMVAGPAVGAGVYLFNRVTGGAVNRLASYQYRITGPWDRPQITRLCW
ncbi:AsmA-like C-terminal region-containing protein [uncultured Thiodictyon sp.]|uniref:YhdP family phospholipid transporter n=1 Tax=uncultured Thiodictyon sp. TaxID=1846217 RepID=UPI0025D1A26F|nr:AsmA-like C-terminal region-containing protein [uncultured Thiodictyon sp.]